MTTPVKLNPTQRRLLNRAVKLKRLQWSCNGLCTDGRPHQYMPHPHARANQLVGSHPLTAFITGRGFGKTRAAAEWAKNRMSAEDGHRLAIVVPTFGYYRVTVEGESGMLALVPPSWGARWNVSKGELKFKNGSVAQVFGTDTQADAERLRGYQFHSLWAEELCEWRHQQLAWDMAMFGLRLGSHPQTVVTTTPKPTPVIRELLSRAEGGDPLLSLRTGSTYDNFDNLPPEFQARIRTYEGSPRGSAEIHGRMLEDVEGALWQRAMIHYGGAHDGVPRLGEFVRIVVAIDPAGTHNPKSDETGIVVCGLAADGRCWVLADLSGRFSPNGWATRAIGAYEDFEADAIVAETNFGAEMVETTLRSIDRNIRFLEVKATRGAGKQARAEPVVDLYQRGMVMHEQLFVELESQMCTWVPGESRTSPDRLDAMVWGVTELVLKEQKPRRQMRFHA